MSGMDRLPDSILQETVLHAEAPLYADMARELLAHRRASQAAPAPSDGLREAANILLILHQTGQWRLGVGRTLEQVATVIGALQSAALSAPAQEGGVKPVCPICKGHSRFDQCSCHYEVKP